MQVQKKSKSHRWLFISVCSSFLSITFVNEDRYKGGSSPDLHAEEFNKAATQKCKDQSSGFAWVNTWKDLVVDKIKTGMSTEELRELDNEVHKWNERGLPEAEQGW